MHIAFFLPENLSQDHQEDHDTKRKPSTHQKILQGIPAKNDFVHDQPQCFWIALMSALCRLPPSSRIYQPYPCLLLQSRGKYALPSTSMRGNHPQALLTGWCL
jgi:hypothetical protein